MRMSNQTKQHIKELRAKGLSIGEIESCTGIKEKTVWAFLRREGLSGPKRMPVYRFTQKQREEIIDAYRGGSSKRSIGKTIGVSEGVIDRVLREHNITSTTRYVTGPKNHKWSGGRTQLDGYWRVLITPEIKKFVPKGYGNRYIQEHRLVMAKHLGRPLETHEQVHHINGDREDNRLENLQLRQGDHGPGYILECRQCGSHDLRAVPIT